MTESAKMEIDLGKGYPLELIPHGGTIEDVIIEKVKQADIQEEDSAIFIANIGDIIDKYSIWNRHLPKVRPFYAVKANDTHPVLKVLADIGVNFDCASKVEIESVLSLGVSPDRIIYAHTCKHASMLKYAADNHVAMTTFDSEQELYKIKKIHPNAKVIIRIRPSEQYKAKLPLGKKFGCGQQDIKPLLELALSLGLNVVGVSFHVGYICEEADAYRDAIRRSSNVFDIARDLGIHMTLLDLGGGFPGKKLKEGLQFEEIAKTINDSLAQYFDARREVRTIAEPGEFFVASAFTLVTQVIGRRTDITQGDNSMCNGTTPHSQPNNRTRYMYYLNDGIFGSFRGVTGYGGYHPHTLKHTSAAREEHDSSLWGPTCDSSDQIFSSVKLCKLAVGDWIYFPNMGAYTITMQSQFNGMTLPKINFVCNHETWHSAFPESVSAEWNVDNGSTESRASCSEVAEH